MLTAALLNDTTRAAHHLGCQLTVNHIVRACHQAGIEIIHRDPVVDPRFNHTDFAASIRYCDIVIVNGEGTLHDDQGEGLLEKCRLAKRAGKLVFLINCVWQANERHRHYLYYMDLVFCRESASQAALLADGWTNPVIVPDMSFHGLDSAPAQAGNGRPMVIDSVLPSVTAVLLECAREQAADVYFMSANNRDTYLRKSGMSEEFAVLHADDERLVLTHTAPLAQAPWVVTGRYHGLCLAMASGTPCIATESNTHKIQGLLVDAGLADIVPHIRQAELSSDRLLAALHAMREPARWHDYRQRCADFIAQAQPRIHEMFETIVDYSFN